jgi:hypothetical protein
LEAKKKRSPSRKTAPHLTAEEELAELLSDPTLRPSISFLGIRPDRDNLSSTGTDSVADLEKTTDIGLAGDTLPIGAAQSLHGAALYNKDKSTHLPLSSPQSSHRNGTPFPSISEAVSASDTQTDRGAVREPIPSRPAAIDSSTGADSKTLLPPRSDSGSLAAAVPVSDSLSGSDTDSDLGDTIGAVASSETPSAAAIHVGENSAVPPRPFASPNSGQAQAPAPGTRPAIEFKIEPGDEEFLEDYVRRPRYQRPKARRAKTVEDGHSHAEQSLYLALWEKAKPFNADARVITMGFGTMSHLARLSLNNCRQNIRSLIHKLAVEEIRAEMSSEKIGKTYLIYNQPAILRRRKASGLDWVIRTKGVVFVDPRSGVVLTDRSPVRTAKSEQSEGQDLSAAAALATDREPDTESVSDPFLTLHQP